LAFSYQPKQIPRYARNDTALHGFGCE